MANINAIYGSTLIAILIYSFLYGLATLQTFLFFKFNDKLHLANKIAITVLWTMSGLDLVFISHFVYFYLIRAESVSQGSALLWSFPAYSAVDFLLLAFAQMLYTVRLWQLLTFLNRRVLRYLTCSLLALLLVASVALAVYLPVNMSKAKTAEDYNFQNCGSIIFAMANGTLIDFILSCSLTYGLIKAAGQKFGWTDSSAVVLLAYAFNTGFFATIFSLGAVLAYATNRLSLTFLAFKIVHVGLYFNSFLAMMNARFYFQQPSPDAQTQNQVVSSYETSSGDLYTRRQISPSSTFDVHNGLRDYTINEVGLPLFPCSRAEQPLITTNDEMKRVEIRVDKQQKQAYHRTARPIHHRVGPLPSSPS